MHFCPDGLPKPNGQARFQEIRTTSRTVTACSGGTTLNSGCCHCALPPGLCRYWASSAPWWASASSIGGLEIVISAGPGGQPTEGVDDRSGRPAVCVRYHAARTARRHPVMVLQMFLGGRESVVTEEGRYRVFALLNEAAPGVPGVVDAGAPTPCSRRGCGRADEPAAVPGHRLRHHRYLHRGVSRSRTSLTSRTASSRASTVS